MSKVGNRFFIVGAPRAGTTWLYSQLSQHPDVHLSPIKEPHYYAEPSQVDRRDIPRDQRAITLMEKNGDLHSAWIRDPDIYEGLMQASKGEKIVGEATVSYLYDERAADRIAQACPNSRIIIVLRNPVERVISHVRMDRAIGRIKDDISDYLRKALDQTLVDDIDPYLAQSLYADACLRYINVFGRDRVLFLLFEDVMAEPRRALETLAGFLEISTTGFEAIKEELVNPSVNARWPTLNKALHRLGVKSLFRRYLPRYLVESGKSVFYFQHRGAAMSSSLVKELGGFFRTDVKKTRLITGLDLND